MRILIAVCTCHAFRDKADAQRATWVPDIQGMDIRFFVGRGATQRPDEIELDVEDDYWHLPDKCREIFRYAYGQGYDYVFKCDDDVYLRPERLLAAVPVGQDYVGRARGAANGYPAVYCSGFGYWLSRRAMAARIEGEHLEDPHEDLNTGNILFAAGINPVRDRRYQVVSSSTSATGGSEGPRQGNSLVATCEYGPDQMRIAHQEFLTMPSRTGRIMPKMNTPFSRIDVLVKTFLRDGMLHRCIKGIEQNLPGARAIIVDDGWESKQKISWYSELRDRGHIVINAPFDTGYGAKSNIAAKHYDREFVLRASDDFDFRASDAADGVLRMLDVLDHNADIGIASGRLDGQPYEHLAEFRPRLDGLVDVVTSLVPDDQERFVTDKGTRYVLCDFTVNYSLVRTPIMRSMKWDERFKIGGDHYDLYGHARSLHYLTAGVEGASIRSIQEFDGATDPDYGRYRGRARMALPWTFERHGWNSWQAADGTIETRETVQNWFDQHRHLLDIDPRHGFRRKRLSQEERQMRREAMRAAEGLEDRSYIIHNTPHNIKPGYVERADVPHFDATAIIDEPWQQQVYAVARQLHDQYRFATVLDYGCGSAEMFLRHFLPTSGQLVGVEVQPTLDWLRQNRPEGFWLSPEAATDQYELVICADVIEHVADPDAFLDSILRLRPGYLVISTPDRDLLPWAIDGPPKNFHHVREWTMPEFNGYLRRRFRVLQHFICDKEQCTQVAVCRPL